MDFGEPRCGGLSDARSEDPAPTLGHSERGVNERRADVIGEAGNG